MNINYRNYPIDYINRLMGQGKRMKARCFMEYQHDVQMDAVNAISFYGVSWGAKDKPISKGTVHKWVGEFNEQLELHHSARMLHATQHYSSVKKQSERKVNGSRTEKPSQSTTTPTVYKTERTQSERKVNEVNIIYDEDRRLRQEIDNLYFIYRANTKNAGKKDEALEEYKLVRECATHKNFTIAIMFYLHDYKIERKYNLKNFLKHQIFLNYIPSKIKVLIDNQWVEGVYDQDKGEFISDSGEKRQLTAQVLTGKFANGELEFIREVAA